MLLARTAVFHTCAFTHSVLQLSHGSPPYLPALPPRLRVLPAPLALFTLAGRCGRCRDNETIMNENCVKIVFNKSLNEGCTDISWLYECRIRFFLGCGVEWVFNNSYDVTLAQRLHPPRCYSALGFTESGSCF